MKGTGRRAPPCPTVSIAPGARGILARSRLTGKDWDDLQLIQVLLGSDPTSPDGLADLRAKVSESNFPDNERRVFWLGLLEESYPDVRGALEILEIAERSDEPVIQESIQKIRRHMELNGKLRELRK